MSHYICIKFTGDNNYCYLVLNLNIANLNQVNNIHTKTVLLHSSICIPLQGTEVAAEGQGQRSSAVRAVPLPWRLPRQPVGAALTAMCTKLLLEFKPDTKLWYASRKTSIFHICHVTFIQKVTFNISSLLTTLSKKTVLWLNLGLLKKIKSHGCIFKIK